MMTVAYYSLMGNTRRLVSRLTGVKAVEIKPGLRIDEPFVLITPTYNVGQVPKPVREFLQGSDNVVAVVGAGNRNWGNTFALAADTIAQDFGVPVLHKFELSGTEQDANIINERLRLLEEAKHIRSS